MLRRDERKASSETGLKDLFFERFPFFGTNFSLLTQDLQPLLMGGFWLVGLLQKSSALAIQRLVTKAEQNILKLLGGIGHHSLLHRCLGNEVLQVSRFKRTQKSGNVLPGVMLSHFQALADYLPDSCVLDPVQVNISERKGNELFVYEQ